MSKLIYYVAASMDGYIATQQGQLDWLENFPLGEEATAYDDFYQGIGAVIIGAETYNWIMENTPDDWPYQNIPAFIMTHRTLPILAGLNITLTGDDAKSLAEKAKCAAGGKDVWLVGGGKTAASFADAGELQQIMLTTIPVFLGTGIPVLPANSRLHVTPKTHRLLPSGAMESVLDVNLT
ncbi:dihydrofolate reductase [Enterobacterales bacterium CwR94]|nr:dihydrofolate reductase [Enterobacterales bacterium CwR94]